MKLVYMSRDDRFVLACELSRWEGHAGRCRWCNGELTGRQQRWCGQACVTGYGENHWWGDARKAAVRRDKRCLRCGTSRARVEVWWQEAFGGLIRYSDWTYGGRFYDLRDLHERELLDASLEVNHIVPRNGAGYQTGCWHHLDGLETLCHKCHVAETTAQRRARRLACFQEQCTEQGVELLTLDV